MNLTPPAGNKRSRHPSTILVSASVERTPDEAWDLVRQLVHDRRRGDVIHLDRRAHEVLKLLGGSAAYTAVFTEPKHIKPKFVQAYRLLAEIDERMTQLGQLVGPKTPPGLDADSQ